MPTFTAKRVSSNQNVLFPDILEIGNTTVSYYKGYVFGYKTTVIARQNIARFVFYRCDYLKQRRRANCRSRIQQIRC